MVPVFKSNHEILGVKFNAPECVNSQTSKPFRVFSKSATESCRDVKLISKIFLWVQRNLMYHELLLSLMSHPNDEVKQNYQTT